MPWLSAAFGMIALKGSMLHRGGLHQFAIALGVPGAVPRLDTLALFRADLLLLFLIIPATILLLCSRLPIRLALVLSAAIAGLLTLLAACQVHVWNATGSFTTFRMTWLLLTWEVASRDHAFLNMRPQVFIAIAGLLFLVGISSVCAWIAVNRQVRGLKLLVAAGYIAPLALGMLAWLPRIPATPWTSPLLGKALYSFFLQSMHDSRQAQRLQAEGSEALLARYRMEVRIPPAQPTSYFGKAPRANVLIFLMESMSAGALDPSRDDLADMPNLRMLRERAFVMQRHYTSFPQTDYALFSMLTSLDARCFVRCSASELIPASGQKVPTLISTLGAAGYGTGYYGYIWNIPQQRDDLLLASLGFQNLRGPQIDRQADRDGLTTFFGPVSYTAANDLRALDWLRQDIRGWAAAHQSFAAVYFPEISHDPYRALDGNNGASPVEKGRALAALEDRWLGQIVEELRQQGILDNTMIVVTGDHGMRFTASLADGSRALTAEGKLDDRVMRVPMLVYVPQALHGTVQIDYPTSHIDVTPTLLDLLGIPGLRDRAQGGSMMDPRLAQRRLYLPMGEYGSSGLYQDGSYFMVTGNGEVYKSATMQFNDNNLLPYDGAESVSIRAVQSRQEIAQAALLGDILKVKY